MTPEQMAAIRARIERYHKALAGKDTKERYKAIIALETYACEDVEALLAEITRLKTIAPAQALWNDFGFLDMHCSNCGCVPDREDGSSPPMTKYCPDCGCRMAIDMGERIVLV